MQLGIDSIIKRAEKKDEEIRRYREGLDILKDHIKDRWDQGYAIQARLYIDQLLESESGKGCD